MLPRSSSRFLIVLALPLVGCAKPKGPEVAPRTTAANKMVAMVIAHRGFADVEYTTPRQIFEQAGFTVTTFASAPGEAVGMQGTRVEADAVLDDLEVETFDAVVFIGGSGVQTELWDNPKAHELARGAVTRGKVLAAICWAPVVLANAGVLAGKRATVAVEDDAHEIIIEKGGTFTGEAVTIDGALITASGPPASMAFAEAIVEALGAIEDR